MCGEGSGTGLVQIPDQVTEGRFVEIVQDVSQLLISRSARRKSRSICIAQGRDERIPMLPADLAVLVAMAAIKA
jgi:hypothetical protein